MSEEATPRISAHPRAAASVPRVRAWAGLAGFGIALWLSMRAGLPMFDACLRALVAGIVANLVAWAFALTFWRGVILAELETVRHRRAEAYALAAAEAEAEAAAAVN